MVLQTNPVDPRLSFNPSYEFLNQPMGHKPEPRSRNRFKGHLKHTNNIAPNHYLNKNVFGKRQPSSFAHLSTSMNTPPTFLLPKVTDS
jgi:hypothetical protein